MPLFGRRRNHHPKHAGSGYRESTTTRTEHRHRWRGGRKDPDRVAGGYKAALANPNTTRQGRERAQAELRRMGRGREAHVPLMTKIKRAFGVRSSRREYGGEMDRGRRY